MGVSLRQLEYFVAVVDEGSFTAAAARLHVSQPGLSHQIQALERQLRGPLLERLPRGVRLAPAGRTALPHARASLAHAERASSAAMRASVVDAGELHVGTLYSISVGVLPAALPAWRRKYPDVQVRLVEFRHTNDLTAAMEAGRADLAVGPAPPAWDGPIREIGAEEFVLAAAPGTQLPGTPPTVRLADLADRDWVHFTSPERSGRRPGRRLCRRGIRATRRGAHRAGPLGAESRLRRPWRHAPARQRRPGSLRRRAAAASPPVRRMLAAYTRVRPDPITAAFVDAICHHTMATPAHLFKRLEAQRDR